MDEGLGGHVVFFRIPRGAHNIHNVLLQLVIHINAVHHLARGEHLFDSHHLLRHGQAVGFRVFIKDASFFVPFRVIHHHLEHEPVHLRFGQQVRAFLLNRVLRGHYQERIGEGVRFITDGHLLLLHRLQQRALHLGRRAVDFIGQQQVGKHRPLPRGEFPGLGVVDLRARHVCRQHVRRELDTREIHVQRLGQRLDGEGLGDARHPLQQHVAVGQ